MVSTNSPVTVQSSDNARLQCIFTGYLPTYYEIIWTDMTGSPINDSLDQYNIDEREGPGQSQRGTDSLESGVLSELTIMSATTDNQGVYTCSINGSTLMGTVQLFVTGMNYSNITDYYQLSCLNSIDYIILCYTDYQQCSILYYTIIITYLIDIT